MHILNKILMGLIFVAAVFFVYVAAKSLKAHQHWREKVQGFERIISDYDEEIYQAQYAETDDGVIAQMGIEQLRKELHKVLVDRGRVWYATMPEQLDADTGTVRIKVDKPSEDNLVGRHGIGQNTVLYIFEEGEVEAPLNQGGARYLGEFRVTEVPEGAIVARPTRPLTDREMDRLANSITPWSLYEVMPIDSHHLLADMDDETLRRILPESVLQQYLLDRQPATPEQIEELGLPGKVVNAEGEPVEPGEEGIYLRPLRDYEVIFRDFHRERTEWAQKMAAAMSDKQYAEEARDEALQGLEFRKRQSEALDNVRQRVARRRDLMQQHRQALERKLAELGRAAAELEANNRQLASQIAKVQLDAQRRIDAKTRRMAGPRAGQ